jgi:uncharacterized protein YacL
MVHLLVRGLFLISAAAVAALYAVRTFTNVGDEWKIVLTVVAALAVSGLLTIIDTVTPRKKLSAIAGVFLGVIVGSIIAYALSFLVEYVDVLFPEQIPQELIEGIKLFIGVLCVFVSISLILQTRDDFRFVIPYVEFAKQIRGTRPMLLDSSAIIDGRILDIAETQILQGLLIVPKFVLNELQTIADSSDRIKRARGRRGLEIVGKLQNHPQVELAIEDAEAEGATVDQKLVAMAHDMHARLITTDYNLNKIAQLRGVDVVNLNDLANAMRPVVLPGETMGVQVIKPGESAGQGVGYLDDGTMVVVEQGRDRIGQSVNLVVTSVLQTSAGRMIFGRVHEGEIDPASAAHVNLESRSTADVGGGSARRRR